MDWDPQILLSTRVDWEGLLSPLQDLVSRENDIPFVLLVLPLITLPPFNKIYTRVKMLKQFPLSIIPAEVLKSQLQFSV